MTSRERTEIYKQGFMDGFKAALKEIKDAADYCENMPPVLPEELFKDRANPKYSAQHYPDAVCPTCGTFITGAPVCQDFQEALRERCWFLEKTVEGCREKRERKRSSQQNLAKINDSKGTTPPHAAAKQGS